jgi:hypothetical protein
MSPIIAAAIAQGVSALIEIWRNHANKPAGWEPGPEDWAELRRGNAKTAEDYEREATQGRKDAKAPEGLGDVMASVGTDNAR